jgi:hypothetical protein
MPLRALHGVADPRDVVGRDVAMPQIGNAVREDALGSSPPQRDLQVLLAEFDFAGVRGRDIRGVRGQPDFRTSAPRGDWREGPLGPLAKAAYCAVLVTNDRKLTRNAPMISPGITVVPWVAPDPLHEISELIGVGGDVRHPLGALRED